MKLKNIVSIAGFSLLTLPSSAVIASHKLENNSKNENDDDSRHLATLKSSEIIETDYYDAMHMYDEAYKSIGILPFKNHLLNGGAGYYEKIKVGVLDNGHINFDAIIKPKNIKLNYVYYPDSSSNNSLEFSNHATHVATFIGGVSGINPNAELYSLGTANGKINELRSKLDWAVKNGVRVINISMGAFVDFKKINKELTLFETNNDFKHLDKALEYINKPFSYELTGGVLDWYSYKYGLIFVNSSGNDLDSYEDLFERLNELSKKYPDNKGIENVLKIYNNDNIYIPLGINSSFNAISVAGILKDKKIDPTVNNPAHYKYTPDKNFISAVQNFQPKWKNTNSIYFKKLWSILNGTSFSSPIIAGLISLIISTYEKNSDWKFDASDIKNILALNSIYVKNSSSQKHLFNDIFDKQNRGGKKTISGYGYPNWVQIRDFFEHNNKAKMFKFNNTENGIFGTYNKDNIVKNVGRVAPNHRYKAALSWLHYGIDPFRYKYLLNVNDDELLNKYFSTSADYSLELHSEYDNKLTDLKYGNHEFINSINRTDKTIEFDLNVHYYKDEYDWYQEGNFIDKWSRTLKFYFKEGEYAKPR